MDTEKNLQLLIQTAKGLAKLMGNNTEVVLHDLHKKEIVYIANGHITGRYMGYQLKNPMLINAVLESVDEEGHAVSSRSRTSDGRILKVSHFAYYDEQHVPYALLCINEDVTIPDQFQKFLEQYLGTESPNASIPSNDSEHYIHQVVRNLIYQEMENIKPTPLDSKEKKMEVLAALDSKGIFDVKDSVPQVCEMLDISQATLYNYLRELRQKSEKE